MYIHETYTQIFLNIHILDIHLFFGGVMFQGTLSMHNLFDF